MSGGGGRANLRVSRKGSRGNDWIRYLVRLNFLDYDY